MRAFVRTIVTILVGGLLFLVPVVLSVLVVSQALRLAARVLAPIAHVLPLGSVAGFAAANVIAGVLLLVACFVAGLVARTRPGVLVGRRLEHAVLRKMPGFTFLKSAAQGFVGLEGTSEVQTALARVEDGWVPAFIVERHRSGLCTVFVPSVPTPAAGTVYLLPPDRVRPLDVPVATMAGVVMRLGVGLRDLVEPDGRPAQGLSTAIATASV
ncbi:MAG: hypothetical protein KIT14_06530 [bacterium]|nr:hypothetical protein [bacterium]